MSFSRLHLYLRPCDFHVQASAAVGLIAVYVGLASAQKICTECPPCVDMELCADARTNGGLTGVGDTCKFVGDFNGAANEVAVNLCPNECEICPNDSCDSNDDYVSQGSTNVRVNVNTGARMESIFVQCVPKRTCVVGAEFEFASGFVYDPTLMAGMNRRCDPITVCDCSLGAWTRTAATATSDAECAALTVCTSEEYDNNPANIPAVGDACTVASTTDRDCQPLTVCGPNRYETVAPTTYTQRVCQDLTECDAATEVVAVAATATSDRVCCPKGEGILGGVGTAADCVDLCAANGAVCTASEQCDTDVGVCVCACDVPNEFFSNGGCTATDSCGADAFIATVADCTTDSVCQPLQVCGANQFISKPASKFADRECTTYTECDFPNSEYECVAPGPTNNRVCCALTPPCLTCAGGEFEEGR
jgi:hypothetical protein